MSCLDSGRSLTFEDAYQIRPAIAAVAAARQESGPPFRGWEGAGGTYILAEDMGENQAVMAPGKEFWDRTGIVPGGFRRF